MTSRRSVRRAAVAALAAALLAPRGGASETEFTMPSSTVHERFPGAAALGTTSGEVELHGRELAMRTMRATHLGSAVLGDFLRQNRIETPVPVVPGAIPEYARVKFPSRALSGRSPVRADLLVIFTIGDFDGEKSCSTYYAPTSPWYNVFYGAYGVASKKGDGTFWGYDAQGNPDFDEMLKVPELDYNFLTAGQLGCPPEKRTFKVLGLTQSKQGIWDRGDVVAKIPSGLHGPQDAVRANPFYYAVFGFPHPDLMEGRQSYEEVQMRGRMFFRRVTEANADEPITLVWGGMCPDTVAGNALLETIIGAMAPLYGAAAPPAPQ
jgi:hypothetical protein